MDFFFARLKIQTHDLIPCRRGDSEIDRDLWTSQGEREVAFIINHVTDGQSSRYEPMTRLGSVRGGGGRERGGNRRRGGRGRGNMMNPLRAELEGCVCARAHQHQLLEIIFLRNGY